VSPSSVLSPRRRIPAVAALALALGLLTACGDDGGSDDAASTTTSAGTETSTGSSSSAGTSGDDSGGDSSEAETIEVTSVDFSYELDEDSFSPGTYEVTLTNGGDATHDLVVERDGEDVARSDQIGPGESTTFEVTLEQGEYVFYCSVGNHRAMGMEVPVEVTS
jgi:plastocyanin